MILESLYKSLLFFKSDKWKSVIRLCFWNYLIFSVSCFIIVRNVTLPTCLTSNSRGATLGGDKDIGLRSRNLYASIRN